jgi:hypothetical protein
MEPGGTGVGGGPPAPPPHGHKLGASRQGMLSAANSHTILQVRSAW